MADNVTISGYVIATNEIGGVHYQRIKIISGVPGETFAAAVGANGLYVDVRTGVLTDAQLRAAAVPMKIAPSASRTVTDITPTVAAGGTQIAANANRAMLFMENGSSDTVYGKYGTGVTSALYSFSILPGDYWEMPLPADTGVISVIWTNGAATGKLLVTEQSYA